MSLLVLTASDVDAVTATFSADELVSLMSRVFLSLSLSSPSSPSSNTVTIPHRSTIPTPHHSTLFMPARLPSMGTALKIVSVPSANAPREVKERGLPASTVVLDETSGGVRGVVNARGLTALRNAASSLLATRLMLPSDTNPKTLVAIGAGAQISAHLTLFLASYPSIATCTVFNRSSNARLSALVSRLRSQYPNTMIDGLGYTGEGERGEYERRLREADIIITATSATEPLFPGEWVRKGAHLCLIGSYTPAMHEVDDELVRRAGMVVVDYKEGAMAEAGELISSGIADEDIIELGHLIALPSPHSNSTDVAPNTQLVEKIRKSGDVTMFKSVGVGVQDVAIAHAVVERAKERGVGTLIENYDA